MGKKVEFDENDINILRMHNIKQSQRNGAAADIFTEDELKALIDETASLKLMSRADKAIKDHKGFMIAAMPRGEAYMVFMPTSEFQRFYSEYQIRLNILLASLEVLKDKGILTNEEITDKLKVLLGPKEIDGAVANKAQEDIALLGKDVGL